MRSAFKILGILIYATTFLTIDSYGQKKDTTIYVAIDTPPNFKYKDGKNTSVCVELFISEHLTWPSVEDDIYAKVLVQCVVEKDGRLSNFKIIHGVVEWCDKKAIEIVQSMPKWLPGKKNNQIVRTQIIIPVIWKFN